MKVHRGPEEIGDGVLEAPDALPVLEDPDERLLHQVLRFFGVVGDEEERSEESCTLGLEELLEGDRGGNHDLRVLYRCDVPLHRPHERLWRNVRIHAARISRGLFSGRARGWPPGHTMPSC